MASKYVKEGGTGDGSSFANAWSWSTFITELNGGVNVTDGDEVRICGDIDHGGTTSNITVTRSSANPVVICGYDGDAGTTREMAKITSASAATTDIVDISGGGFIFMYLWFDNATLIGLDLRSLSAVTSTYRCKFTNCPQAGINTTGRYQHHEAIEGGSGNGALINSSRERSSINKCYSVGVSGTNAMSGWFISNSLAHGGGGISSNFQFKNTVHDATSNAMLRYLTTRSSLFWGCVASSAGTYGYYAHPDAHLFDCSDHDSGVARGYLINYDDGAITHTVTPYKSAADDDYRPNYVPGGGNELRQALPMPLYDGSEVLRDNLLSIGALEFDPEDVFTAVSEVGSNVPARRIETPEGYVTTTSLRGRPSRD